jgi:hypothetical protein
MKLRTVVAILAASAVLPAFAGTDDLSVAAQMASKSMTNDASIGMAGATYDAGSVTMSHGAADMSNGSYPPPVPEPATWAMLAGGLSLVALAARRRRR